MSRYDRPSHRVYVMFFYRGGWHVQFLEADAKTPLPQKIRELARRAEKLGAIQKAGRCWSTLFETGRGGCYLRLTPLGNPRRSGRTRANH